MNPELSKILKQVSFPEEQYYKEVFTKKTIVLHHTAGSTAESSIEGWKLTKERVATPVVIDRDGLIYQCYGSQYWAYSLGLDTANRNQVEQQTIPIELANYGYLRKEKGFYYNAYKGNVDISKVCDLGTPFRGFQYYEKYTNEQVESLRLLLHHLCEKYNISKVYNSAMFNINANARAGASGIWSHTSYRADKSDINPQNNIVEMLKNLNS